MPALFDNLSQAARLAPESGIVELVNRGRLRDNLLPLWVGEGDLPTPDFITRPAMAALSAGETFYTWQRGIPELRDALARYHLRHFGRVFSRDNFIVTGSGMQHDRQVAIHPDTGASLTGVAVPYWDEILKMAARSFDITGLGYVGVDVVLDERRGPLLLELNGRPGLSIQIANRKGLRSHLHAIQALDLSSADVAHRVDAAKRVYELSFGTAAADFGADRDADRGDGPDAQDSASKQGLKVFDGGLASFAA